MKRFVFALIGLILAVLSGCVFVSLPEALPIARASEWPFMTAATLIVPAIMGTITAIGFLWEALPDGRGVE